MIIETFKMLFIIMLILIAVTGIICIVQGEIKYYYQMKSMEEFYKQKNKREVGK